ncbi:DUF4381 domain-containing protein [Shewanella sp. YIC-542]|uniref:DUF4381 domain-containing protein n=1 Tax=Shewanella mytili TaxID=3377111 RepID=UPI00398E85D5
MMSTATANPALSTLKDIHLPPEVGFWPPAPGIWTLAILLLGMLAMLGVYGFRRYRARQQQQAPAKAALALLAQLDPQQPEYPLHISALLKRCAISYDNRAQVAGLTGEDWYQYLDKVLPLPQRGKFGRLLANRYRLQTVGPHNAELAGLCQQWLRLAPAFYRQPPITHHRGEAASC